MTRSKQYFKELDNNVRNKNPENKNPKNVIHEYITTQGNRMLILREKKQNKT